MRGAKRQCCLGAPVSAKFEKVAKEIARKINARLEELSSAYVDPDAGMIVMSIDSICRFPGGMLDRAAGYNFLELIARNLEAVLPEAFASNYTLFVKNDDKFSHIYANIDRTNEFSTVPVALLKGTVAVLHSGPSVV